MKSIRSINWYIDNGCELQQPNRDIFFSLYIETKGDLCRECNCKNTCPAWVIMQADEKEQKATDFQSKDNPMCGETNAQIAKRLGISKRQAAKLRKRR